MNRNEAGKLVGDVEAASTADKVAFITPVPGGVGPMTIAMLLKQTIEIAGEKYLNGTEKLFNRYGLDQVQLRAKFTYDPYLERVYLVGEISNFRLRQKHQYFSIKDENAKIEAVMFQSNFNRIKFVPEDGMKVLVTW